MKYIKSRHNLVHEKKSKTVDIEITIEDDLVELMLILGDDIGESAPSIRCCKDLYQAKNRARTVIGVSSDWGQVFPCHIALFTSPCSTLSQKKYLNTAWKDLPPFFRRMAWE